MTATSNFPFLLRAVDLIPASDSAETNQNSEPSIGVNPMVFAETSVMAASAVPEATPGAGVPLTVTDR